MTKPTILATLLLFLTPPLSAAEIEAWKPLRTSDAVSVRQEWKPTQDGVSIAGTPLRIAGRVFTQGLGTHAPGEIIFDLTGKNHKTFKAVIGVDDGAEAAGSVAFTVYLDGKKAFDSGVMKHGDAAKEIRLDITGVRELKLVCTDGGDGVQGDWADWADAAVDDVLAVTPKAVPQFSTAGFYAVPGSPRKVWSFNPGWRFHKGDVPGAEKPDFDDSLWEAANLPHGLEILGSNQSGGRNYQGPAWYRKKFTLPAEQDGKRTVLYFEAVMGKAKVFLDGRLVAKHLGGYLPFAADITEHVKPGKTHTVAVLADNSDDPSFPPGKPQGNLDFTYLGGIYRDVYLISYGQTHVTLPELSPTVAGGGVFVGVLKAQDNTAEFEVRTEIATEQDVLVHTVILDDSGKEIGRRSGVVSARKPPEPAPARSTARITRYDRLGVITIIDPMTFDDVRLWHPDDPYRYCVLTKIYDVRGETLLDSMQTRFGIRLFEMRGNDGFYINGKPMPRLSGVNRHQDYACVGNAVPNSGQWRDAKLLREGGSTIVRAAHYPLDPAFMDACDELGLLVTVANPGWQFYNDKNPEFWQRCVADTRAMARRDRNRPAVVLWETALNETDNQPAPMLAEMHAALHEEIPYPGVFSVGDSDHARPAGLDVYYYARGDEPITSMIREYGDGGEVENFYSQNAASRVKREWGEHAMLQQAMIRYRDLPGIYGGSRKQFAATLWCGIDHQRGYHPDPFWGGLLDEYRLPKYSYYAFKSQYAPDFNADGKIPHIQTGPMVHIAHELTQISPADVLVMTNCEEVRLTWLGKVVGTQRPEDGYKGLPHPPVIFKDVFHFREINTNWRDRLDELEMVAEGLIGGKVVRVQKKKYPQRTTRIMLETDDHGCGVTADGGDFIPVRATITDARGMTKVLAPEYVTFLVDGAGEMIGGQAQHVNPMKAELGVATALIRASTTPGLIRVRAVSAGLLPSEELIIPTAAAPQPLLYNAAYMNASRRPASEITVHVLDAKDGDADTQTLRDEIERLKLEAVSREQDLMEFKNRQK